MKGEIRAAKRASVVRTGLSDITNSPMPLKVLREDLQPPRTSEITAEYVDQLIQENKQLLKLIEERNKIIELSGVELQKLRISYQKTQLQNWNLAQSNSQMLAELNLGKDKLKALQHELACKNALLRSKNLELQGKVVEHPGKTGSVEGEQEAVAKANDKSKTVSRNRRHQRSQSLGVSSSNKQDAAEKEKGENKRRCMRRQSARFISQECEPAENLFEIEEAKFPPSRTLETSTPEPGPDLPDPSYKEDKENNSSSKVQRASIGRPLRRAAEKIHSYKEPPVNIKMRRE